MNTDTVLLCWTSTEMSIITRLRELKIHVCVFDSGSPTDLQLPEIIIQHMHGKNMTKDALKRHALVSFVRRLSD